MSLFRSLPHTASCPHETGSVPERAEFLRFMGEMLMLRKAMDSRKWPLVSVRLELQRWQQCQGKINYVGIILLFISKSLSGSVKQVPASWACWWTCHRWCHILGASCLRIWALGREWHRKDALKWQPVLPRLALTYHRYSNNKGRGKISEASWSYFFFFSQEDDNDALENSTRSQCASPLKKVPDTYA